VTESPASRIPSRGPFSCGRLLFFAVYAGLAIDILLRILRGDIMWQLELAVVFVVTLVIVLPVRFLARRLSQTRLGRYIHADARTTRLLSSKRLIVNLRDEPNSMLVAQGLVLALFVLMVAVALIAYVVRLFAR
jgi:hypothetical protein